MRILNAPPEVELSGFAIAILVNNLQSSETLPTLRKYGLTDVNPEGWYPAQTFLNALNELISRFDVSSNLVTIGMEAGNLLPPPPGLTNPTLGQVLTGWDALYHLGHPHHRNDIGAIACEKVNDTHYKLTITDIYPDDFAYGTAYSFARRFLPPGAYFKVYYDPDLPQRDVNGTDTTVIHVRWE